MVTFNIQLDILWLISGSIFPANHLTGTKTRFKPTQTATKLQHKNYQSYKKLHVYKQNYI